MRLVADSQPHLSRVFQYFHQMTKSDNLPPLMSFNSQCASDSSGKANLFNKLFYSVFTRSSLCSSNQTFPSNHDHISFISCEDDEVFRILSTLDGSKAVGIDGISPLFLRHCAVALTPPLTRLFNLSLSSHSLPLEWRTRLVKPIFKSGDKCNVVNYRPISLLPAVSKVLERIMYNNVIDYVCQHKLPSSLVFSLLVLLLSSS